MAGFASLLAGCAALGTHWLVPRLIAWRLMDVPNARSSHHQPTPRGGGLAPVCVLLLAATPLAYASAVPGALLILGAAGGLAALSLSDDRTSLGALPRLAAQAAAVVLATLFSVSQWPPVSALPAWLVLPAVAFGWLWFINLFNFMDGIDGISGTEIMTIGGGAALVAAVHGQGLTVELNNAIIVFGIMLGAVAAGFLTANWHPARVFMGDVGSIPLGFMCGGLLIGLASTGQSAAATILPACYVLDATVTLLLRLWRRERVFEAHRTHAYQRAVQRGQGHATVVLKMGAVNLVLVALAVFSPASPVLATVTAYAVAATLMLHFSGQLPVGK